MLAEPFFEETACRTRERLGKEYRISHATVDKYGTYANAIDSLSKIEPDFILQILSGQIKVSQENIIELSRLSPPDIRRISAKLLNYVIGYSSTKNIIPNRKKVKKEESPQQPAVSVKNMPVYDPDAEILSLIFTIPSWVSSINRAHSNANLTTISDNARNRLENELINLKTMIDVMLSAIKEGS